MREGGKSTPSLLFNGEGRSCALDLLRTISVTDGGNYPTIRRTIGHRRPTARYGTADRAGLEAPRGRRSQMHLSACVDIATAVTRVARVLWSRPFVHENQTI